MEARYWIAQHVSDPFRNEPRNVGVIVQVGSSVTTRFFGEGNDGVLDGRSLRHAFQYPDVYKQWIQYWRKESLKGPLEKLLEGNAANFRVQFGGEVSDIAGDTSDDVAKYLYAIVVSESGFKAAIHSTEEDESAAQPVLDVEISNALDAANILGRGEVDIPVPHPVRKGVHVLGRASATYVPAFVQRNGHLVVMETVDFTRVQRRVSRDHAGWSAYMFHDIRSVDRTAQPIAVVRMTEQDADADEVRNGIAMLHNEGEVVNWLDPRQREQFLADRRSLAFG
jgi:hypothetical protein